MARVECPHESDVLTMVVTGQWAERAPADLRAHVAACELCADLALVAQAIDEDHSAEIEPRLPSPGTMWWRAQLRARQDAAHQVGRPITVAQAAFLALLGGAAGAVFGATTDWFQRGLEFTGAAFKSAAAAVRLPSLPMPMPADMATTFASYGPTLLIAGVGAAVAMVIMVWALREG
jgi:hypothetical protein